MIYVHLLLWSLSTSITADTLTTQHTITIQSEDLYDIQHTIQTIEQRLTESGYDPQIKGDTASNIYTITSNLDTTSTIDSIQYYAQFQNNRLALELLLRQDDKIIRSLYKDLSAIDGLIIPEDYDPTAIFVSRDPQLLDEQKEQLINTINTLGNSKYESLRFIWSHEVKKIKLPNIKSYSGHLLYVYNDNQSYGLSETDIQSASVSRKPYGEIILLQFKESANSTWENLTVDAASDDARPLAIILNEEVIDSHPIRLMGDPCIISGISNRKVANDIADKIRLGRLHVDVEIR